MKHPIQSALCASLILAASGVAQAAIIDFHFTGNVVVTGVDDSIIVNQDASGNPLPSTPIDATLSYNTDSGIGASGLSITMPNFLGNPATFHDITLQDSGANSINGQIFVDWAGNFNMPLHINWDATGFFNAINVGLNVGDTISGTTLKQDTDGDGVFDTFTDVFSATPHSDALLAAQGYGSLQEGAAPLAATSSSKGVGYDINGNYAGPTPFDGVHGYFNIGSGNSLTVTGVSAVPVPAAAWLFGSGLIGLLGVAKRKR